MIIVFILYSFLAIAIIIQLLVHGIRPTKTLAWLLVIFTIPVGGLLFYLIFGQNKKRNKFYKLKETKELKRYLDSVDDYYHTIDADSDAIGKPLKEHIKLVKLITKSSKFYPSYGNELLPLKDGPATFKAIFEALENAKNFIHIQYYIFEDGELAQQFLAILQKKAKQGVKIRFMYDGLGSRNLSNNYIDTLKSFDVEVFPFLPIRFGKLISSINYRNHRKIVIVDGQIAFTGGINVSDKYINGDDELGIWHDMHLQLRGPVVNNLQAVFSIDWSFASGKEDVLSPNYFLKQPKTGNSISQTIFSGPDSDFSSIRQLYFSIINNAKNYVYIVNPYIIPGEVLMEALQVAALSGIDVRLLLSTNSDSALVKWTVRSYFEDFLEAGVKIYLYPEGFLHSKIIISDDALTTIGTANLDNRSFEQNYEVNVLIYETSLTQELKHDFLLDCAKSSQISYQEYIKRPKIDRLKEGVAKVFSPVL